jgi:hypothetical protein
MTTIREPVTISKADFFAARQSFVSVRANHLAGDLLFAEDGWMSEEKSLGMKWRSREAAEELVKEFEASGLRRKQFCEQRGLSLGTLDLYRKRLRSAESGVEPKVGLVRVKVSAEPRSGSGLQFVLSDGLRLEVAEGFDEATLKRLLGLLGQS